MKLSESYDRVYRKRSSSGRSPDSLALSRELTVMSAARLHFGFLDISGSLGRKFGSIGLSISAPRVKVRIRPSDGLFAYGEERYRETALKYAAMFYEHAGVRELIGGDGHGAEIFLDDTIPRHQGFGSGTQLALCIASALSRQHGLECSPGEAARITRRGLRSGIGIESFNGGGFIVDAGSGGAENPIPLTLFRSDFPVDWRVILIIPPDVDGLCGCDERSAFENVPPEDAASVEICRLVLMKLLPAVLERKLMSFGEALERIQRITGESFSGYQPGQTYASPMAGDLFQKMAALGAVGMGQSSWGPVLYGFVAGDANAEAVSSGVKKFFAGSRFLNGAELKTAVVLGRNSGASVMEAPL